MRGCNLAQDLVIHTSFDDLDHISSSQVCQNCKLKIVLRFLSTVVYWCMVATHIRKIKSSKPFVTGVYLKKMDVDDYIVFSKHNCKMRPV